MQNKPITPEQYLLLKKDDIKAVLIGAEKYDYMVNLVHELRKCRNSKATTQKVLDPFFKTPFDNKEEIEKWLMSAFWHDDSFVYAYNCMVEDQNVTGYRYDEKSVSERELHTLLLVEQVKVDNQNSASNILDIVDPNLKYRLLKIYEKAIVAKVIKCTDESFLYWFGGRTGEPQPKITWKKLNMQGNFHKSALFYFCKKMNSEMEPKEMTEIFGEKIKTQNKNFSAKDEIDKIFK